MGKTATERSREYRKRVRLNPDLHLQIKAKERLRWKERSEKDKTKKKTKLELSIQKEKERLRKANWRKKKLLLKKQESSPDNTYSPSALGKAVARVKQKMPKEPEKKVAVIAKIIQDLSPSKQERVYSSSTFKKNMKKNNETRKIRSDATATETVQKVQLFFERDDISRLCPGRKDFVIIRDGKSKTKIQKRVLQMTVQEVYLLFIKECNTKIGISLFHSLRPKYVLPMTEKDREVCYCVYHENLDLLLAGFKKTFPELGIQNIKELLKLTVCKYENLMKVECADRKCKECGVNRIYDEFEEIDNDRLVTFYQWISIDGKSVKSPLTLPAAEVIENLKLFLIPFSRHVYNINRQFQELQCLKQNLKDDEILIIEDFAENFSIRQQNEIMNAHWCSVQVTIFTAIVYYKENNDLMHICYGVVSDDAQHDKNTIFAYNSLILEDFKKKLTIQMQKVHYWSDGPSSQFKNRFTLGNLVHHESDFGCLADWSFFETSHGKGPADGVGAELKRYVNSRILQNQIVINDAAGFYEVAKNHSQKIIVLFSSEKENNNQWERLKSRWQKMEKSVPRTLHYAEPFGESKLKIFTNSPFTLTAEEKDTICQIHQVYAETSEGNTSYNLQQNATCNNIISVGNFVVVEIKSMRSKDRLFVGQVTVIESDNIEVMFLRKCNDLGTTFTFPEIEDRSWICRLQVLKILPEPVFDDKRFNYKFSECIENIYK